MTVHAPIHYKAHVTRDISVLLITVSPVPAPISLTIYSTHPHSCSILKGKLQILNENLFCFLYVLITDISKCIPTSNKYKLGSFGYK